MLNWNFLERILIYASTAEASHTHKDAIATYIVSYSYKSQ